MKNMRKMLCAVCVMGCVLMSSALGTITFVDVTPDNATLNGATLVLDDNYVIPHSPLEGLWGYRTRTDVEGGSVWVTDGGETTGDAESTEALKVDLVLAEAGVYDLYAIIMNNNGGTGYWDVSTRIGDVGDFTDFNKNSAAMTAVAASDFDSPVTISTSTTGDMTAKVLIGQYTTTTANETVSIYVNGFNTWGEETRDQRTRFDGVGYEMVPEPATLILLSAGAFLGLRRRK